jgi:hypothetical protein
LAFALRLLLLTMPSAARADDARDLARICVSEAGFETGSDCAAILAVLRDRTRVYGTLRRAMRAYSPRVFDRTRTDARRWIAFLRGEERPEGWPRGTRWVPARWFAVVEHARLLLASDAYPCNAAPHHWGAPWLDRSGWGWIRLECKTKNVFWRIGEA